jgi:alkanesulfonate monooxygenase SsuD/methylene tetrahydromethanopterin reductase-like flavin-dependent oxidoreductase (luciferase family)
MRDGQKNREAARLADAAGIEFLLPIARWLGYGGLTDRQGTSFETLSWAWALLAATNDIVAFATVHVPLVNPVFAAKSCVTADHVGQGRFGLNGVSGWPRLSHRHTSGVTDVTGRALRSLAPPA